MGVGTLERSAKGGRGQEATQGAGSRPRLAWVRPQRPLEPRVSQATGQPLGYTLRAARGPPQIPGPKLQVGRGETLGIKTGGNLSGRCPPP